MRIFWGTEATRPKQGNAETINRQKINDAQQKALNMATAIAAIVTAPPTTLVVSAPLVCETLAAVLL